MGAASEPSDSQILQLFERLAAVGDVVEACSLVLNQAVVELDLERAVVVVGNGKRVEGVGWGISDHRLNTLLQDDDDDGSPSPLVGLLELTAPTVLDGGHPVAPLGFSSCAALPFRGPSKKNLGVLLLDAPELDRATRYAAVLFHRCAPSIEKTFELDQTKSRIATVSRQRDLLNGIINDLGDPVLLTDAHNDILLANKRAEQLLSAAAEDSEGRRRAIQINNLLFTAFRTQTVIGADESQSRELNLVDPSDGSDLLFEVISDVAPSADTEEDAVISILRDITDLKRAVTELESQFRRSRGAEHRARRERDRLNAILENVGDPILVTDDQSNLIQMNGEAERLFMVPGEGSADVRKRRMVRANDTKFSSLVSDFLLQGETRRVEKLDLEDPDTGKTFPAEAVSSKILNARGEPSAIVAILHDLTQVVENQRLARELKELNEDLEQRIEHAVQELEERNEKLEWQSRELEKASRLKSEFLASMSHELRTPINALLGFAALMQERIYGELTPQQEMALEKIRSASRHLLDLINDILDLSKIEAGKMQLHVEPVDFHEVARELAETIQPLVEAKCLDYVQDIPEDLPLLQTDRTKLKQVLLNLLSNAIKFTHEGEITLEAAHLGEPDWVQMTVRDTGIGIEPEKLESIFEEFRQVDGSHTREYGGTGLGLSITRKLVDLLGGGITVDSDLNRGSVFTVEIPVSVAILEPDEAT